jgi:hypothetical protein
VPSPIDGEPVDVPGLRARLAKMTDAKLVEFGKAAAFMCSPRASFDEPPRQQFVIQMEEARVE